MNQDIEQRKVDLRLSIHALERQLEPLKSELAELEALAPTPAEEPAKIFGKEGK